MLYTYVQVYDVTIREFYNFTLKFVWIWSPFQSRGSFFIRRLSRGK